jgi:hypothetical protein
VIITVFPPFSAAAWRICVRMTRYGSSSGASGKKAAQRFQQRLRVETTDRETVYAESVRGRAAPSASRGPAPPGGGGPDG